MKLILLPLLIITGSFCKPPPHCNKRDVENIRRQYLEDIFSRFHLTDGNSSCSKDIQWLLEEFSKTVRIAKDRYVESDKVNQCLDELVVRKDLVLLSHGNILQTKCQSMIEGEIEYIKSHLQDAALEIERCSIKPSASCPDISRCCDDVKEEFSDDSDGNIKYIKDLLQVYQMCILRECEAIRSDIRKIKLDINDCLPIHKERHLSEQLANINIQCCLLLL